MLKQKLIPMLGVTVLLFGCGSNSTIIEINNPKPDLEKYTLVSKDFDAKEGQKFTFTVNHSNLLVDDSNQGSALAFAETPLDNLSLVDFINEKESISITYNDKKMQEFKEGGEKFIEYFSKKEFDKIDETYAIFSMKVVEDPVQVLILCHKDKSSTDKITYNVTSAVSKNIVAVYMNALDF